MAISVIDPNSLMMRFISRLKNGLSRGPSEKERNKALAFARDQFHVGYFDDHQSLVESTKLKSYVERSSEDFLILASQAHQDGDTLKTLELRKSKRSF